MGDKPRRSSAWDWERAHGHRGEPEFVPDVVSPTARRVLKAAKKAIPRRTNRGPAFDDPEKCPMEIHDYQMWLHEQLRLSGLAKGIAGGPAFLPDITNELSWPWNVLSRLFAPRNYEQLTRRIAVNLEWYMDQSRQARDLWKAVSELFWPCIVLTAFLFVILWFTTGMYRLNWVQLTGCALAVFFLIFASLLTYNRNTLKHETNTAELFVYLAEEYSEPGDEEASQVSSDWERRLQGMRSMGGAGESAGNKHVSE